MSQITTGQRLVVRSITTLAEVAASELSECLELGCCGGMIQVSLAYTGSQKRELLRQQAHRAVVAKLGSGYTVQAHHGKMDGEQTIDICIFF